MKRSCVSLLFVLFFAAAPCLGQYHITYEVKGLGNEKATLSSVRGSVHTIIDSTVSDKNIIHFDSEKQIPVGVYRINFDKNLFTDIILNHETVKMKNDMESLLDDLVVTESDENKIYYDYWRTSLYINDTVDLISEMGQKIFEANKKVMTHDLDSMAKKAFRLETFLKQYTQKLIDKSHGMYVQKLLMAYLEPDWDAYKMTPNPKKYPSHKEFLKEHFFDHIDFSDSTLLNSEVFYVLCTDYLSKYVDPQSDSNYTKAVDLILKKCIPNSPVYKYILHLLIETYVDTEWEDTFVHLVDNYLLKNNVTQTSWDKTLAKRAATIKSLKPGNKAPDFTINNDKGGTLHLSQIQSKVILLLFWSSTCPHCEEAMPAIKVIYKKYHPLGLTIVAVSVETDKKAWLEAIQKNNLEWVNASDLKGMVSPVIESYNAFSTPTFYLLDTGKTILAHPNSPKEMQEALDKAFGK